jgi:hypothetical protein
VGKKKKERKKEKKEKGVECGRKVSVTKKKVNGSFFLRRKGMS